MLMLINAGQNDGMGLNNCHPLSSLCCSCTACWQKHMLEPDDEFLLLGCNKLWDVVSSQLAVNLAHSVLRLRNEPTRCSQELVRPAHLLSELRMSVLAERSVRG